MKSKQFQTGSVHLVIIILLAVALIGALGFVFYQNFFQSKTANKNDVVTEKSTNTTNTPTATTTSEIALTEVASDTTGTGLAIKYPKTWVLAHETTQAGEVIGAGDKNTITSADGNVKVILDISRPTGIGSDCNVASATVKVLDKGEIKNYPSLGFVYYNAAGSGDYIGVSRYSEIEGKTDCVAYDKSRFIFGYLSTNSGPIATLQANFTGGIDISSDNYKTAKLIIQSLYKKD